MTVLSGEESDDFGCALEGGAGELYDDFGREFVLGVFSVGGGDGGVGEGVDFLVNGDFAVGESVDVGAGEGVGGVVGEHEGGDLPVEVGVGGFGHGG